MTIQNEEVVIIIGAGGREHALGWKLSQSRRVKKVYYLPGNGGTEENIPIAQNDIKNIVEFAAKYGDKSFTVVGPEEPLSLGIADEFSSNGLRLVGPSASAAKLETSKAFSKEFMLSTGIPTASAEIFSDAQKAMDYINANPGPIVVKADGIAAGKGVIVCENSIEAKDAINRIMIKKEFGHAGDKVVIEERLTGEEASFIALCDGNDLVALESCQDHKRAQDGDRGPNTGGMGAYSPARIITPEIKETILKQIMEPTLRSMKLRGDPFVGFLYAGIMIERESGRPYVLEFNARMGDPECQALIMRLDSDLFEYLEAAAQGTLGQMEELEWKKGTSVCVVMASRGYPEAYKTGFAIRGLDSNFGPSVQVFHAGTRRTVDGHLTTSGGRVLGVTSFGHDARHAIDTAYSAVRKINWGQNDQYYRTDIGKRALGQSV